MIKLLELIAGKFDLKETLKLIEEIFKHYKVKTKIKWANYTDKFAHYEVEKDTMYVSKKLNKTTDSNSKPKAKNPTKKRAGIPLSAPNSTVVTSDKSDD